MAAVTTAELFNLEMNAIFFFFFQCEGGLKQEVDAGVEMRIMKCCAHFFFFFVLGLSQFLTGTLF